MRYAVATEQCIASIDSNLNTLEDMRELKVIHDFMKGKLNFSLDKLITMPKSFLVLDGAQGIMVPAAEDLQAALHMPMGNI